MIKRKD